MLHDAAPQISTEDRGLIEDNRLGTPLSMYVVKNEAIRHSIILGWFASILSFLALIVLFALAITEHPYSMDVVEKAALKQEYMYSEHFSLFTSSVAVGCLLIFGLFLLLFYLPSLKRSRIIVCTNGLLQVRKKIVGDRVEAIHWHEIQSIKLPFAGQGPVRLLRKSGKPIVLVNYYEDLDELLAQVKQHSHLE